MAKLNPDTTRQGSALADEEDDGPLRPPPRAQRKPARSGRELVPNYDPSEDPEQFLRARRRVLPRKSRLRRLWENRFGRVLLLLALLVVLACLGACAWAVRSFLVHDPHFRIDSSASIQATGNTELTGAELIKVFGSDLGRNVFFVPLARREAALEAEPWVRHATVMRLLPNTIHVTIEERVPIAFIRIGREIELVDGEGVLLNMPPATLAARHYSFPVVTGLDPSSPPQARAARMHLFQIFVASLDGGPAKISSELSEVDLSDPDDVRAVVPAQGTDIMLHFGNSDFLERYRSYQEHIGEWRQQYPNLSAVDLRYDRQVVLKMAEAAEADEAAEGRPLVAAAQVRKPVAPARHSPVTTPARKTAAHAGAHRIWYTERRGPHGTVKWVPHSVVRARRPQ